MARKQKTSSKEAGINPNAWMTTFADLVMLLLTFFVLLLTMSSMDQQVLKELFSHLSASTGVLGFSESRQVGFDKFMQTHTESDTKLVLDSSTLTDMFTLAIRTDKKLQDLREHIHISNDGRGLVMAFQELALFGPGDATLKKDAHDVLDATQSTIESCANDILIMGHTDSTPIRSKQYESNWELSLDRGLSVLEYFLENKTMSPTRFYVGGYGDSRPRLTGDTSTDRASNRRVEIIFKPAKEE